MGMARNGAVAVVALLLAACTSLAPGVVRQGAIRIDHMVLSASGELGTAVDAYAGFDNRGGSDRLLGIECDCAASIELHTVVRAGGTVSMTNTFPLELPAGARTEVKPPGIPLHFMLIDTRRRFAAGERVPMHLRFERAGTVAVDFTVVEKSADGWAAWPGH